MLERLGLKLLQMCDAERAHLLSLWALKLGAANLYRGVHSPRLHCSLGEIALQNPLGLAAGYDKDVKVLAPLAKVGFGFLEFGAVTPKPQAGNPRPRLFRLKEDAAAINRFGFNNQGVEAVVGRLKRARKGQAVIGLNLGANKDSPDRAGDYCIVLEAAAPYIDFATLNISSPNTQNLRDFQKGAALEALLARILAVREATLPNLPLFVKIAPDLGDEQIDEIAKILLAAEVDGIIATNTTASREGVAADFQKIQGGLSGKPLFARSTRVLARLYVATGGKMPLIGVGGISSADDAEAKIKAGASALQIYTAFAYHGLGLVEVILKELDRRLAKEGIGIEAWRGRDAAHYAR